MLLSPAWRRGGKEGICCLLLSVAECYREGIQDAQEKVKRWQTGLAVREVLTQYKDIAQ